MEDNTEVDDIVSQLVCQITDPQPQTTPLPLVPMSRENIEQFLLDNTSTLIRSSVETIEKLKPLVVAAPTAEDVEALSKLIGSSAAAIETLSKIHISNKRNETAIQLKKIDAENKRVLQETEIQGRIIMNREELLKQMFADAVDVTPVPVK